MLTQVMEGLSAAGEGALHAASARPMPRQTPRRLRAKAGMEERSGTESRITPGMGAARQMPAVNSPC
ncbi:hypothetical protein ASNO1_00550 [Corallococcus caeni]|uniref:Uncharacterized protein n=1 Tax=Corallococcus caeni TaxID=3082388 RepID=A0ABQ6QI87_9BACT|nr:hypothetical protein ASNO1_00550 [Corallococcus sp. NO1]